MSSYPDKFKKLAVVVFLTLLIWAYAYLALEQTIESAGILDIAPPTNPELLVSFDVKTPKSMILSLKGPASKIAEFRKRWRAAENDPTRERLDFYYDVEKANQDKPGTYTLDVFEFLQESEKLKEIGLKVQSCSLQTVEVKVELLEEKRLRVQCVDTEGNEIKHESIDPSMVSMYVRPEYNGPAYVALTERQIGQARINYTRERPYIIIDGKHVNARIQVRIALPPTEEVLSKHVIQPTIGFNISPNLLGKYTVELLNADDLTRTTSIEASQEAFEEFEKERYQLIVEVRDGDESIDSEITRSVTYNFPQQYIRSDKIRLGEEPRMAVFKVVPIKPAN